LGILHRNLKCFAPRSVWSQVYTDSCTRIHKNINVHGFVNQNQYEHRCAQSYVLGSVRMVTYVALCSRINMRTNAHFFAPESILIQVHTDLCTRIDKNSIVHQNQYECRCTQSCVLGSIKVGTYTMFYSWINVKKSINSVVHRKSICMQLYTELCTRVNKNKSLNSVVHQNQYEYRCTQSFAFESVRVGTYVLLCMRTKINTNVHQNK
jgi:hypothetical protein